MGKRREFTNEFKLEAVRLVERREISAAQVARDLGVCESVLGRWVKQFGRQANGTRVTPDEHEELIRLRRENRRLTLERDILKKAVGIFSKELP
jgi:transposase